jgi:hypothetical protein
MDFFEEESKLPQNLKVFFGSNKLTIEFEKACFMYGVKENDIQNISEQIGLIFVKIINLNDLPKIILKNLPLKNETAHGLSYEINKRIYARFPDFFKDAEDLLEEWSRKKSAPLISQDEAWKKVLELEPWILEEEKEKAQEERKKTEELKTFASQLENFSIDVVLKKYPETGEQLITQNRIKLAVFPDPVRPSIKNWLADYSYVVGISNHDPIVRGNYLFKSENGRTLNSQDREKLAEILKSFEEKTPLTVNTKTKQIIFLPPTEKRSEKPLPTQQTSATNSASPVFATDTDRLSAWRKNLPQKETLEKEPEVILPEKISFSSPQTFSTEKVERTTPTLTRKYSPFPPQKQANSPQGRPMPKNVVNLREE